jgi:nucleoside-diphosphate-sugar epimerase
MTILVTGDAGRIGKRVVALLHSHGHETRGFDTINGFDLRDFAQVRDAVRGVDAIVHAGAIPSDRKGHEEAVFASNAQGTWNILLSALEEGIKRVVHFSSVNALGAVGGHRPPLYFPVGDDYPHHPLTPYQIAKHISEETCRAFVDRWGMEIISLRPMFVSERSYYERWDWMQNSPGAIGDFWGYVDIDDVADAVYLSLTKPVTGYHAFLLCADDISRTGPTASLITEHYPNVPWRVPMQEWFAQNSDRALMDTTEAKRVLDWQPTRSWRDVVPTTATEK